LISVFPLGIFLWVSCWNPSSGFNLGSFLKHAHTILFCYLWGYIAAARTSAQKTQPPLFKRLCWGYHVIAIQPVHWSADCRLSKSYNILYWGTASIVARCNLFTELLLATLWSNLLRYKYIFSPHAYLTVLI
jgi:hypothetical protein